MIDDRYIKHLHRSLTRSKFRLKPWGIVVFLCYAMCAQLCCGISPIRSASAIRNLNRLFGISTLISSPPADSSDDEMRPLNSEQRAEKTEDDSGSITSRSIPPVIGDETCIDIEPSLDSKNHDPGKSVVEGDKYEAIENSCTVEAKQDDKLDLDGVGVSGDAPLFMQVDTGIDGSPAAPVDEEAHTLLGSLEEIAKVDNPEVEAADTVEIEDENNTQDEMQLLRDWITSTRISTSDNDDEEDIELLRREEDDEGSGHLGRVNYFSTPTKLLYAICSKIRPIRTSPDFMLRIRSASEDDANVAASALAHVARETQRYDAHHAMLRSLKREDTQRQHRRRTTPSHESAAEEILKDRRLEQLVECILCGVDIKRRMKEAYALQHESEHQDESEIDAELESIDMLSRTPKEEQHGSVAKEREEMDHDAENARQDKGLSAPGASNAAWGLAVLLDGKEHSTKSRKFAGKTPQDIVVALSLRCREILLARWYQWHRELHDEDMRHDVVDPDVFGGLASGRRRIFDSTAADLARDAVLALWSFVCAEICIGVSVDLLIDKCFDILASTRGNQIGSVHVECNDLSKECIDSTGNSTVPNSDLVLEQESSARSDVESNSTMTVDPAYSCMQGLHLGMDGLQEYPEMISHLTPKELTKVLWCLAVTKGRRGLNEKQALLKNAIIKAVSIALAPGLVAPRTERDTGESSVRGEADDDLVSGSYYRYNDPLQVNDQVSECSTAFNETSSTTYSPGSPDVADISYMSVAEHDKLHMPEELFEETDGSATVLVDAATLLDSGEGMHEEGLNVGSCDDAGLPFTESIPFEISANTSAINSAPPEKTEPHDSAQNESLAPPNTPKLAAFSAIQLCSVLWALTEIEGQISSALMEKWLEAFLTLDGEELKLVSGSDLSNVVWALSQFTSGLGRCANDPLADGTSNLPRALEAISSLMLPRLTDPVADMSQLDYMRLLQAFESIYARLDSPSFKVTSSSIAVSQLAQDSIKFMELKGLNYTLNQLADGTAAILAWNNAIGCKLSSKSCLALGRIQTTIEASLLHSNSTLVASSNQRVGDNGLLIPIFGRSRILRNEVCLVSTDDHVVSTRASEETVLDVSPPSIIKLAYNLCQYQGRNQAVRSDGMVRFFAHCLSLPKSADIILGQLTSIDVTRLLWVCAKTMSPPSIVYASESREASNHVARRIIHYLNNQENTLTLPFERMDATYLSKLCWSLAKLGVQVESDRPGKKLFYSHSPPLPRETELGTLTLSDVSNLLWAMTHIGMISANYLHELEVFLLDFESKLSSGSPDDLFFAYEAMIIVRRSLSDLASFNDTVVDSTVDDKSDDSADVNNATADSDDDIVSHLISLSDEVIVKVAHQLVRAIPSYPSTKLRRLLQVYGTLPFQIGGFLDRVEDEVKMRCSVLSNVDHDGDGEVTDTQTRISKISINVQDLVDTFHNLAANMSSLSSGPTHQGKKIKWNILEMLHEKDVEKSGGASMHDQEANNATSLLQVLENKIHQIASEVNATLAYRDAMEKSKALQYHKRMDDSSMIASSLYELGKCQELIEQNRQVIRTAVGLSAGEDDDSSNEKKTPGKRFLDKIFHG